MYFGSRKKDVHGTKHVDDDNLTWVSEMLFWGVIMDYKHARKCHMMRMIVSKGFANFTKILKVNLGLFQIL